jgi:hypothetical protein
VARTSRPYLRKVLLICILLSATGKALVNDAVALACETLFAAGRGSSSLAAIYRAANAVLTG